MEPNLIATPVSRLVCSKCGHEMDVAGRDAFSEIVCPQCATRLTIPVMLGQFLLIERMGSGGMGAVYRALDTALNRFVAIKVMKAALGEDNKLVQSFISEAQAAAALNHPNIVQIYSCGTEKGQPYIVMELVTGGKMNHMFSRTEPMPEVKLLKIALDVAEGLRAANDIGLVHGDIKPENVLIDQNGTAKIVDFGLAQFVNAQKERGEIWGTPYYISPERARGNKADHRSDIYSLGATMFHALSGQPPFDGPTAVDVVLARLKHPPPNLLELRPDLQVQTVELVNRMMAADPHLRYPNSASLKSDMRAALTAAKESGGKHRQKKNSNTPHLIIGALAAVLLIGVGFALFKLSGQKPVVPTPPSATTAKPPVAAEAEKPAPEDDLFSIEEVKGPDGKVRLKMTIKYFTPEEEAKLIEAATALAGDDIMEAHRKIETFGRGLPRNSAKLVWIPLLEAIPLWAAGLPDRAQAALATVGKFTIRQKDDHPAHMPVIIARQLRGELDAETLRKRRSEWPAWFGDLLNLMEGVRDVQAGVTEEGMRKLKSYSGRDRTEPAWVYAYRPAVARWSQSLQDWEDIRRRIERQLNEGVTAPARESIQQYLKDAPPMMHAQVGAVEKRIAAIEADRKAEAGVMAARAHRVDVQRDLDRIDQALREVSPLIMRNRDFRKASISLSTLPGDMTTDEGRDAARLVREQVDSLDALKAYLLRAIDTQPYNRADGSDLGGDVISASSLGVRTSLDGRSITTRGWDSIPVRSFIKMAEFYAASTRFEAPERADAYTSLAIFCLMNGAFDPAATYAAKAAELNPDLQPKIRRLLPGVTGNG